MWPPRQVRPKAHADGSPPGEVLARRDRDQDRHAGRAAGPLEEVVVQSHTIRPTIQTRERQGRSAGTQGPTYFWYAAIQFPAVVSPSHSPKNPWLTTGTRRPRGKCVSFVVSGQSSVVSCWPTRIPLLLLFLQLLFFFLIVMLILI